MSSDLDLSDVLHDNWLLHQEDVVTDEQIYAAANLPPVNEEITIPSNGSEFPRDDDGIELLEIVGPPMQDDSEVVKEDGPDINIRSDDVDQTSEETVPMEKRVLISPPYVEQVSLARSVRSYSRKKGNPQHQVLYYSDLSTGHGLPVSSTYHQPFVSMVRTKKHSAITNALQRPLQTYAAAPVFTYIPGYPVGYGVRHAAAMEHHLLHSRSDMNNNDYNNSGTSRDRLEMMDHSTAHPDDGAHGHVKKETSSFSPNNAYSSSGCSSSQTTSSPFGNNHQFRCSELPAHVFDAGNADYSANENDQTAELHDDDQDGQQRPIHETVTNGEDADILEGQKKAEKPKKDTTNGDAREAPVDERNDGDEEIVVDVRDDEEEEADDGTVVEASVGEEGAVETTTSSTDKEHPKSALAALLSQPIKKPIYSDFQPILVTFSASGTQQTAQVQSSKTMQFYQPPAQQHLARATPPPGFGQVNPYGMNMRPHEEETRQIMNLDNQQTHSSSPTSSWNQAYPQMTNLNAYQPRGQALYAPAVPTSMVHQNGPQGVVPTSNPYYQAPPHPPQHHHLQPQAPMMPPAMHQQQQPYYNTQSPLTGTPPSMNYGTPQMPAPQPTNGSAPIFNFSKPRNSNESSSGSNGGSGGGHRRKKQNDLSSPRYNNNSDEVDSSVFPDMSDFPLLDVVQSKAKKDAGRKPCRPHLCEQSRMLISRVCHFHREFVKRLPSRHALSNSPLSKPDQWTSAIMGISLATVRKCVDMATEEEVFTRCTDKNLVNLTPSERGVREELLSKLSSVFEDEKSLGAGTAGLTIAEYSPSSFRRSYSNTLLRQSTDDKSSTSSYAVNGVEFGSSETTLLNLDDHSNSSKDFGTTPTPGSDLVNGGHIFEEIGSIGGANEFDKEIAPKVETPKRGRPRKTPGTATTKSSRRKESNEDSEVAEDKDEHEKKTEDEDETNEETEKKTEETQQLVLVEREDDAASSEGTNRSETATPEPAEAANAISPKKTRASRRKKRSNVGIDEDYTAATKKKRGSIVSGTSGLAAAAQLDDENEEHKMLTRARSRQP